MREFFNHISLQLLSDYRGPLVLLRVELGVLSRGNLRPLELVAEYIQQNDLEKVCGLFPIYDVQQNII